MANPRRKPRDTFRELEQLLTKIILGTAIVFVLMLAAGGNGVGWLKFTLAIPVLLVSGLGTALLIVNQEYKKRRSWWMLASFASLFVVTLVSLILKYPG